MRISVAPAKAWLSALIRRAEAGGDIVLARRGPPVARLTPIEAPSRCGHPAGCDRSRARRRREETEVRRLRRPKPGFSLR